jgi:16S rRNA (uracil1498-N3)-methyltransferase
MPRFFIKKEDIQENKILITNLSDINHITNVLRHKKKDRLILSCDDNYVYEAEITSINPDVIETVITDKYFSDKILKTNITLAQSIIKSQKQDFLIQKATELGVKTIIPFISKNTVVKFDSEKDKLSKVQRWQKIVYESAKQCQRGDLAEVKAIATLDGVLNLQDYNMKIFCSEKEGSYSIKEYFNSVTPSSNNVLLVIGPEGGWDDKEINKFAEKGFASVTLGKLIYRAETAATVALSHIIYALEL